MQCVVAPLGGNDSVPLGSGCLCLSPLAAQGKNRQNTWREKKNSITWPVCSKMCLSGHFDNDGSRFPSPSLSDPLLCLTHTHTHTHTHTLSLSYFLPPTSIAICILMNLGAVSSRSVIPTSCFSLSSCFYIFIFCALLLLTPHPFLPVSISQKKPAHANSAWTEQHHFIKSSAKHVRRCLLEVVLAQVRA